MTRIIFLTNGNTLSELIFSGRVLISRRTARKILRGGGAQGRYTTLDDTNNVLRQNIIILHSTHPSPDDGSAIRETDFGRE